MSIVLLALGSAILHTITGYAIPLKYNDFIRKWVARSLFFLLIPLIGFEASYESHINTIIRFILISFSISTLAMIISLAFHVYPYKKSEQAVLISYFNIGWFGIPIANVIFGQSGVSIITAAYMGGSLFGATVGIYLVSSSRYQPTRSLYKILKTPLLYALILGFIIRGYITLPEFLSTHFLVAKKSLSFLGMTMVGLSIRRYSRRIRDVSTYKNLIILRQCICFIAVGIVLALGLNFSILSVSEAKVLAIIVFFPIAANIIVLGEALETESIEKLVGPIVVTTILSFLFMIILTSYIALNSW